MELARVETVKASKPHPISWSSRDELPLILNKLGLTGVGVEVGVERANHLRHIREHWNGKLVVAVDKWEINPTYPAVTRESHLQKHDEAMTNIKSMTKPVEVLKMWSVDAARHIAELSPDSQIKRLWNGGLSFVFLDADHSYTAVVNDIAAWWPLIHSGGILCGHDYISSGFHIPGDPIRAYATAEESGAADASPYGVKDAVNEAFGAENVALTSPHTDGGWRSWAIIKP